MKEGLSEHEPSFSHVDWPPESRLKLLWTVLEKILRSGPDEELVQLWTEIDVATLHKLIEIIPCAVIKAKV